MSIERVLTGETSKKMVGPELGKNPLPVEKGPFDFVWKIWSVIGVWPLSLILMATTFVLCVPITLLVPLNRFQRLFPAPMMGLCVRTTLSKCSVTYHPDFDRERPTVFCMNHTSVLDGHTALWVIPQAFCGMMHAHHFSYPFYGWLMRKANGIGVKKGKLRQFEDLRDQVLERASRGISVLTFPEGRRTQNGRILPYRRGVLMMARDAELPVVPIAVRGLWQIMRKGEWVGRRGHLDVHVGPQIETKGLDDEQLKVLAERMRAYTADWAERGILGDPKAIDPRA